MLSGLPELDPNESVELKVRRHWIALAPVIVCVAGLGICALGLIYILGLYGGAVSKYLPLSIVGLAFVVILVLMALIIIVGYWVYSQNQLILTNQHLVQVTQNGLFNRTVSQLSLARVQDVEGSCKGMLASMLGFGDIIVETAGEEENFHFQLVADPYGLSQRIMKVHERLVTTNNLDPTKL